MKTPFRPLSLFACAALVALPVFSGCNSEGTAASPEMYFQMRAVRTVANELDHPGYDASLPGYWLVGNDSIVQLIHPKDVKRPKQFCFMIRTKPTASAENPTDIDIFRIVTERYIIVSKFDPKQTAPVDILSRTEKKEGTEVVMMKSDTTGRYLRFERVGEYVKVTITEEGLGVVGDLATVSWRELPPGKKSDSAHSAAEAEGWRRVL